MLEIAGAERGEVGPQGRREVPGLTVRGPETLPKRAPQGIPFEQRLPIPRDEPEAQSGSGTRPRNSGPLPTPPAAATTPRRKGSSRPSYPQLPSPEVSGKGAVLSFLHASRSRLPEFCDSLCPWGFARDLS